MCHPEIENYLCNRSRTITEINKKKAVLNINTAFTYLFTF